MLSLNSRLVLAVTMVLASFLGITGWTLDQAFRNSVETALRDRLQVHTVGLIAAAEPDDQGQVLFPRALPEARYNAGSSGLYAQISSNRGAQLWQSPSMRDLGLTLPRRMGSGERRFWRLRAASGIELYAFSIGVTWDLSEARREGYTFSVAEDLSGYYAQIHSFRRTLWGWLGGVALVVLVVQSLILRWGLRPLRRVAADLRAIEAGERKLLAGSYPREMRGLTDNLNALLLSQRSHLEQYRHTLGDLAHSLKTPLAVIQGSIDKSAPDVDLRHAVREQVNRMTQIVEYQLQRAATSGRMPLAAPLSVADIAHKVAASLNKVYADKAVKCDISTEGNVLLHGDEGDLMELLGNLMDNAYKWCRRRVNVSAQETGNGTPAVNIMVADDGPGIPPEMIQGVLQRGIRGDPAAPGHGIGLAIVQNIVRAYGGGLELGTAALGGAQVTVRLPS